MDGKSPACTHYVYQHSHRNHADYTGTIPACNDEERHHVSGTADHGSSNCSKEAAEQGDVVAEVDESRKYDISPPPCRHTTGEEIVGDACIEPEIEELTEGGGRFDKGDDARFCGWSVRVEINVDPNNGHCVCVGAVGVLVDGSGVIAVVRFFCVQVSVKGAVL